MMLLIDADMFQRSESNAMRRTPPSAREEACISINEYPGDSRRLSSTESGRFNNSHPPMSSNIRESAFDIDVIETTHPDGYETVTRTRTKSGRTLPDPSCITETTPLMSTANLILPKGYNGIQDLLPR